MAAGAYSPHADQMSMLIMMFGKKGSRISGPDLNPYLCKSKNALTTAQIGSMMSGGKQKIIENVVFSPEYYESIKNRKRLNGGKK